MATPKKPKEPAKIGRPTDYSLELTKKICNEIATTTDGIAKICGRNNDFPAPTTIFQWRIKYPEFSKQYEDAKRHQAELLAGEIIDISDNGTNDYYEDDEGNEKLNSENIQRSRLRVDARKWVASKLLPKVYGDKTINESTVTIKYEDQLKSLDE